ncbi:MAG: FeoB-associated Cys-rich membrane protein [Bacteroidaceae bacterium]|nr:FeoB-associated Cys-rich membrane protein [Bacteroidaceae bacterium]
MNAATVISIIAIAALVTLAVISSIRKRKSGSSCCGCSMRDCCSKAK